MEITQATLGFWSGSWRDDYLRDDEGSGWPELLGAAQEARTRLDTEGAAGGRRFLVRLGEGAVAASLGEGRGRPELRWEMVGAGRPELLGADQGGRSHSGVTEPGLLDARRGQEEAAGSAPRRRRPDQGGELRRSLVHAAVPPSERGGEG